MGVLPNIKNPDNLLQEGEDAVKEVAVKPETKTETKPKKEMPPKKVDIQRKQRRVMQIIDHPDVQEKLKKKVATKRAKSDSDKVTKAGGDDTRPLRTSKKPKKEGSDIVSDTGPKTKSVRSRNAK